MFSVCSDVVSVCTKKYNKKIHQGNFFNTKYKKVCVIIKNISTGNKKNALPLQNKQKAVSWFFCTHLSCMLMPHVEHLTYMFVRKDEFVKPHFLHMKHRLRLAKQLALLLATALWQTPQMADLSKESKKHLLYSFITQTNIKLKV